MSQDPIDLSHDIGPSIQINWHITAKGWSFVSGQGIVLKSPPAESFSGATGPQDYHFASKRWVPQSTYRYTLFVTDGSTTLSWDPWIAN